MPETPEPRPLIDVLADDGEPPGPTLRERAQDAQDRIGWANMVESPQGDTEFSSATLDLARLVTDLAREVESLRAEIAAKP